MFFASDTKEPRMCKDIMSYEHLQEGLGHGNCGEQRNNNTYAQCNREALD